MTMSGDSQHSNSEIKKHRRFRMTATAYIKMRLNQLRRNRRKNSATVAAAAPPVIEEISSSIPKRERGMCVFKSHTMSG